LSKCTLGKLNLDLGVSIYEIAKYVAVGFNHRFILKSGKLGKWKKAPKKDYKIEDGKITYLGKAKFIEPVFGVKK